MRFRWITCNILHVTTEQRPLTPEESQEQANARIAWDWVLGDLRGRRVLARILDWCGVHRTGYVAGVEEMAGDAGKRLIGNLLIAQILTHQPEVWIQMERDRVERLTFATIRHASEPAKREREAHQEFAR